MTEEDTFRALCKPTYWEMRKIWDDFLQRHQSDMDYTTRRVQINRLFKDNGWTTVEYSNFSLSLPDYEYDRR